MTTLTTCPPRVPASDRYRFRLLVCTRHGWSAARQSYSSRSQAREAALWLINQTGVTAVHVTAGETTIHRLTKHEAPDPRRKPR